MPDSNWQQVIYSFFTPTLFVFSCTTYTRGMGETIRNEHTKAKMVETNKVYKYFNDFYFLVDV